jgi:hypothetical protein
MEAGDQTCIECDDDEGTAWLRIVGLLIAMLLVVAVAAGTYHCYQTIAARGAQKEAGQLRWVKPNFVSGGAVRLRIVARSSLVSYSVTTDCAHH